MRQSITPSQFRFLISIVHCKWAVLAERPQLSYWALLSCFERYLPSMLFVSHWFIGLIYSCMRKIANSNLMSVLLFWLFLCTSNISFFDDDVYSSLGISNLLHYRHVNKTSWQYAKGLSNAFFWRLSPLAGLSPDLRFCLVHCFVACLKWIATFIWACLDPWIWPAIIWLQW